MDMQPTTVERSPAGGAPRSRRRLLVTIAAIGAVVVVAVGLIWFQPQKLFVDKTVDEAVPAAPAEAVPAARAERAQEAPATEVLATGAFRSLAHTTKGSAVVQRLADGSRVLRLEGFETENGPDLRVYLSAGPENAYGRDALDLGALKGNIGNQNYVIPADADLGRYSTAVIWCRRFTVGFGAAALS